MAEGRPSRPYRCECGADFFTPVALRTHRALKHPEPKSSQTEDAAMSETPEAPVPQAEPATATPNLPAEIPPAEVNVGAVRVPADAVPTDDDEITVLARYPYQMEKCQAELIAWAKRKQQAMQIEADDLGENLEIAVRNNWGTGGLTRALDMAVKRVQFYEKIVMALEAGYVIVPNFPVEMFAIRTRRKKPDAGATTAWSGSHTQEAQVLPAGEGRYLNPEPVVHRREIEYTDAQGKPVEKTEYFAHHFRDELDFPFATAKPAILSAAEQALADKFFDDLGALPGSRRKGDPIIVGRIYDPRHKRYSPRFVTFMIAWFVDTRDL